jgi:hypothetical protein
MGLPGHASCDVDGNLSTYKFQGGLDDLSGQRRPASISSGTPFHEAKTLSGMISGLTVAPMQKGSRFQARWIEVKYSIHVSGSVDRGP